MQHVTSTRSALNVNEQRLWQRHIELAHIGGLRNGGTNRQAFTPEEADARRLIARWAAELKCSLSIDEIGNLFIRRAGTDASAAPVVTGSHIDTQPTGGKFDGNFGVLAGLEVLQILNEAGVSTRRQIEVAIWTNEEGCRFAPGMMGSEAFAGVRNLKDIVTVKDSDGISVAEALPALLAATPEATKRPLGFPIAAFIEAHIEQGPILEAANCVIGVVTGIQGTRRFRVEVFGEEDLRTNGRLNGEGNLSVPLLGSIHLAGLTLTQAASRLTDLYARDYLVNPRVNVMLIGYAKRRFTMLGQINRPGSYEMPDGSPEGIDLLEAVAMAGGYTRIAAPERISIRRHSSSGRDEIIRVDAKRLARGDRGNFTVLPGDAITVGESIF